MDLQKLAVILSSIGAAIGIVAGIVRLYYSWVDRHEKRTVIWKETLGHVEKIYYQIKNEAWEPQVIISFPKGGLIVADLLNHRFNCSLDIVSIYTKRTLDKHKEVIYHIRAPYTNFDPLVNKRILIVDDVLENGITLKKVIDLLCKHKIPRGNIKTAVLGRSIGVDPALQPDYFAFDYVRSRGLVLPWGEVTL